MTAMESRAPPWHLRHPVPSIKIGFQIAFMNNAARFLVGIQNRDDAGILIVNKKIQKIVHGRIELNGWQLQQLIADPALLFLAFSIRRVARMWS